MVVTRILREIAPHGWIGPPAGPEDPLSHGLAENHMLMQSSWDQTVAKIEERRPYHKTRPPFIVPFRAAG